MAVGDLNPASWRIEIYKIKNTAPFSGYITDLSNFYTSELTITRQRNYPDEISFTLDLGQLQERADTLGVEVRELLEPYIHNVKVYRNNVFIAQGIVVKTTANLNNDPKNTVEVSCVDILGIFEKRLIHQDYGGGSWADFAKEVVMDAQHEPNRIYNYAFEGDGTSVENVWFRGWKFTPGENARRDFPDWEPNHLYSMYDTCNHDGKFWEAKEHAFYSGETFSESNWTLLGVLDVETGEVAPAYGVWREDEEEPGPTGTALGGWGGTSSCHMTAKTFSVNNGGGISGISMAGSEISTTLVAPYGPHSVEGTGKNLFDINRWFQKAGGGTSIGMTNGGTARLANGKITMASTANTPTHPPFYPSEAGAMMIPCKPNTKYTLSWETDITSGKCRSFILFVKGDGTYTQSYVDSVNKNFTVTTNSDTVCLAVTFSIIVANTTVNVWNVQLEEGERATPYEHCIGPYSLPDEYQRLEYIESDGAQWIDTNIVPLDYNNKLNFYTGIKFNKLSPDVGDAWITIYGVDYGKIGDTYYYPPRCSLSLCGGTSTNQNALTPQYSNFETPGSTTSDISLYGPHISDYEYHDLSVQLTSHGCECYLDVKEVKTKADVPNYGPNASIYLFSRNEVIQGDQTEAIAEKSFYRMYYMEVHTMVSSAERAIGVFVPCYRKSDGAVGMYNSVTGTFHENKGTRPFIKGPEVQKGHIYSRIMAKRADTSLSASIRFFVEGYGGRNRQYSEPYDITGNDWQKIEHEWLYQRFDSFYRFGLQILSGDVIFDTPVFYQAPMDGDEWDLGVRIGDFPSAQEQIDAGWSRNRHTTTYEWKNAKSTLLDLSNMDSDNFWYNIDEGYKFNLYPNAGADHITLELSYPRNITTMSITTDAKDIVNYIKGDGSADIKQDPLVSGVNVSQPSPFTWIGSDPVSMSNYWALADAISYNSETTIDSLKNDIMSNITTNSVIQDVPEIKIANNAVTPDQFGLGDIVSVETLDVPYVKRANGLYKIIGYKIDVDIDGNESVSLTLLNPNQNQINALSFPQMIKNVINRLKS